MTQTFTVVGTWPFPVDMLRRDEATAATPEDQAKIDRLSVEHPGIEVMRTRTRINLTMPNRSFRDNPTVDRWKSFGWRVVAEPEPSQDDLRQSALNKLTPAERDALGV